PTTLFHVDAVQSVGKLPIALREWNIDLLSMSAHKLHGPRGVGALYCREGVQLVPLLAGGGQEGGLRSGTEPLPLIAGMAKAVRLAQASLQANAATLYKLRERLVQCVASIPELQLTGSPRSDEMAPHIVHCSFPGMKSEVVVHALEEHGIQISTRSACSSGETKPSRVLTAMGLDDRLARSGLRISFSAMNTLDEIDYLCAKLTIVVKQLKPMASTTG